MNLEEFYNLFLNLKKNLMTIYVFGRVINFFLYSKNNETLMKEHESSLH